MLVAAIAAEALPLASPLTEVVAVVVAVVLAQHSLRNTEFTPIVP